MRQVRAIAVGVVGAVAVASLLAGCGASLNPFKKEEVRLPGERIAIATGSDELKVDPATAKLPVALSSPKNNENWTQPGGVPSNAPGHLKIGGALSMAWRTDIGQGSTDEGRLTASPVVYQNRIFTIDTEGQVTAVSASGGGRIWRVSLVPENEKGEEGYGGGLAVDEGRLYAVTGFGTVVALNPANGDVIWKRDIGAPVRASPTAAGGKIYFVTTESRLYCLSGKEGNQLWTHRGIPETAILLSNASPAVVGNRVVVPFASGDVVAYDIATGRPTWVESLARRRGGSGLASLSDAARPVVDGGVVYAVGHSGRMVATAVANGERLWTKSIRSTQTPWVSSSAVFVVDVEGKLFALDRRSGNIRWVVDLPQQGRWNGPVLASGRLWLVSAAGLLVGVDAKSGQVNQQRELKDATFIAPVIASGRMYILSDKARLYAFN